MSEQSNPGGMHVEESGEPGSPAIVFLHGVGQSSREWREHMARLSGFHCLAPDLPGFGQSSRLAPASKDRIADLIADLIAVRVPNGRASVVGISSAGMVVHALLERHPERVERAIIDGSPPYHAPRVGRGLMRLLVASLSPFIHDRPVRALLRDTHDPADLLAADPRAFGRGMAECFTTSATVGAHCPTLLLAGERESRVRPTNAALAALMPRAEAWFAPGLGHCWQRVAPDLHIRTVEAWTNGQGMPSELLPEAEASGSTVAWLRAETLPAGGMRVEESGTLGAPAILFLHGMGQSGRIWREHMAALRDFHCLAPDLPGFGRSNHLPPASNRRIVAHLAELIETRVPAKRAHVVGLSWGATLTLELLRRHPQLVERAIADSAPMHWPRGSRLPLAYVLTAALPFKRTAWFRALFGNVMDEVDLRDASRLGFWRAFVGSMGRLPDLAEATPPTLLVAGERERLYRPTNAALAAIMPSAEARFAPGVGHCWQLRAPELHIHMVDAWVTGQALPMELRPEPDPSAGTAERVRTEAAASA